MNLDTDSRTIQLLLHCVVKLASSAPRLIDFQIRNIDEFYHYTYVCKKLDFAIAELTHH